MKWTAELTEKLTEMAFAGEANSTIATTLGISLTDVYAKRSQLGITIDKVKDRKAATINKDLGDAFLPSTAELVKSLRELLLKADDTIKNVVLSCGNKAVTVTRTSGQQRIISIEGDSPLAIIFDVVRICLF